MTLIHTVNQNNVQTCQENKNYEYFNTKFIQTSRLIIKVIFALTSIACVCVKRLFFFNRD